MVDLVSSKKSATAVPEDKVGTQALQSKWEASPYLSTILSRKTIVHGKGH